jgi:hypothetical protein
MCLGLEKCMYLINTVFIGFKQSKLYIILSDPLRNNIVINAGNGIKLKRAQLFSYHSRSSPFQQHLSAHEYELRVTIRYRRF